MSVLKRVCENNSNLILSSHTAFTKFTLSHRFHSRMRTVAYSTYRNCSNCDALQLESTWSSVHARTLTERPKTECLWQLLLAEAKKVSRNSSINHMCSISHQINSTMQITQCTGHHAYCYRSQQHYCQKHTKFVHEVAQHMPTTKFLPKLNSCEWQLVTKIIYGGTKRKRSQGFFCYRVQP